MGCRYFLQAEGLTPPLSVDRGTEQVPWDPGARAACSGQGDELGGSSGVVPKSPISRT